MDKYLSKCRACLKRNGKFCISIVKDGKSLRDIMSCLSIQISDTDVMPQYICNICHVTIMKLQTFKQICEKSDQFLRELIDPENEKPSDPNTRAVSENIEDEKFIINGESPRTRISKMRTCKNGVMKKTANTELAQKDCHENFANNLTNNTHDDFDSPVKLETDIEFLKNEICIFYCEDSDSDSKPLVSGDTLRDNDSENSVIKSEDIKPKCEEIEEDIKEENGRVTLEKLYFSPDPVFSEPVKVAKKQRRLTKYLCASCGFVALDMSTLRTHAQIHTGEKPFPCTQCDRRFAVKTYLKRHMQKHTGLRRFVCEFCGRACASAFSLRSHMNTHTGVKPHVCKICSKAFARPSNLRDHVMRHGDEKPYSCDICGVSFKTSSEFHHHKRRHTGARPHACEQCPRTFAEAYLLRAHELTHAPVDLTCRHCDRTFTSKASLAGHKSVHNSGRAEKIFGCEHCEKRFSRRTFLNKHRKTHEAIVINGQSIISPAKYPNTSGDTHTVQENSTQEIVSNHNQEKNSIKDIVVEEKTTEKFKSHKKESENHNLVVKTIRASNHSCQNRKQNRKRIKILPKSIASKTIKPKTVLIQNFNQLKASCNMIATPSGGSFPITPSICAVPMRDSGTVSYKILGTPIKIHNSQNFKIHNTKKEQLIQTSKGLRIVSNQIKVENTQLSLSNDE